MQEEAGAVATAHMDAAVEEAEEALFQAEATVEAAMAATDSS